jgi:hypothetical protein
VGVCTLDMKAYVGVAVISGSGTEPFEIVETDAPAKVQWERLSGSWCPACGWEGVVGDVIALLGVAQR